MANLKIGFHATCVAKLMEPNGIKKATILITDSLIQKQKRIFFFCLVRRKKLFITVLSPQHVLFVCVYTTGGFVLIIPQTSNSNYGVTLIKIRIKII